jgi:hypothetical protein
MNGWMMDEWIDGWMTDMNGELCLQENARGQQMSLDGGCSWKITVQPL